MFPPSQPDLNINDFLAVSNAEMVVVALNGAVADTLYTYTVPAGKKLIILSMSILMSGGGAQPYSYLKVGNFVLSEHSDTDNNWAHICCKRFPFFSNLYGSHANNTANPLLYYMTGGVDSTTAAPSGNQNPLVDTAVSTTRYYKVDAPYLYCLKAGATITLRTSTSGFAQNQLRAVALLIDE